MYSTIINILKLEIPGLENVKTEGEGVPEKYREGFFQKQTVTCRLCNA